MCVYRRITYNLVHNEIKFHGLNYTARLNMMTSGVVHFIRFLNNECALHTIISLTLYSLHISNPIGFAFLIHCRFECRGYALLIPLFPLTFSHSVPFLSLHVSMSALSSSFPLLVSLLPDDFCLIISMLSFVRFEYVRQSFEIERLNFIYVEKKAHALHTAFDIEHGIELLCDLRVVCVFVI